jgi:hypothetical protein
MGSIERGPILLRRVVKTSLTYVSPGAAINVSEQRKDGIFLAAA